MSVQILHSFRNKGAMSATKVNKKVKPMTKLNFRNVKVSTKLIQKYMILW